MRLIPIKRSTIQLLRIPFSLFLLPVFLLSLSQAKVIDPYSACWVFFILHVLVYPSSNGYNSYIDKDETSIGGLEKPHQPTIQLFYATLILDVSALVLAFLTVNLGFTVCLLLYILVSRAYSSPQIRLKKYPIISFLIVIVFQGPFTYYLSYLGVTGEYLELSSSNWHLLIASMLQIAAAYPLTQIYQFKEDVANGDITISYLLGYTGTFLFTSLLFALSICFYYLYFESIHQLLLFSYLVVFMLPIAIWFFIWFNKVLTNSSEANYKNAMRMSCIASMCSSACFLLFIFLKYIS